MDADLAKEKLQATVARVPRGRSVNAMTQAILRFAINAKGVPAQRDDGEVDHNLTTIAANTFGGVLLGATFSASNDGRRRLALDLMQANSVQESDPDAVLFASYRVTMDIDDKGRVGVATPLRAMAGLTTEAARRLFQEDGAKQPADGERILGKACRRALVAADALRARPALLDSVFVTPTDQGLFRGAFARSSSGGAPLLSCTLTTFESTRERGPLLRERLDDIWKPVEGASDPLHAGYALAGYLSASPAIVREVLEPMSQAKPPAKQGRTSRTGREM